MNIIGDLGRYTQFQAARSMPLAAANEGGAAGSGAGIGAGVAMGQWLANVVSSGQSSTAAAGEDVAALIEKLHALKIKGILTETEFDEKKAELLKKLI